jgi:hypothetical protein
LDVAGTPLQFIVHVIFNHELVLLDLACEDLCHVVGEEEDQY